MENTKIIVQDLWRKLQNIKDCRKELNDLKYYLEIKELDYDRTTDSNRKEVILSDIKSIKKRIENKEGILSMHYDDLTVGFINGLETLTEAIMRK